MLNVDQDHDDGIFKVFPKDKKIIVQSLEYGKDCLLKSNLFWKRKEEINNQCHWRIQAFLILKNMFLFIQLVKLSFFGNFTEID